MYPRVLLLVATLLVAADPPKEDLAKSEAIRMEGTWTVISEGNSADTPTDLRLVQVIIKADQLTFVRKLRNTVCQFSLDPTTKPKQIDLMIVEGQFKGKVMEGIYAFEDGELKLCYNYRAEKGGRPTEFANDNLFKGTRVVVLKREKP